MTFIIEAPIALNGFETPTPPSWIHSFSEANAKCLGPLQRAQQTLVLCIQDLLGQD